MLVVMEKVNVVLMILDGIPAEITCFSENGAKAISVPYTINLTRPQWKYLKRGCKRG